MKGIGVWQAGQGKDLLFLHGYLAAKESFYPQLNYFSRFYRVTALDFPGFGESGPLTQPFSVGDYADWTERFLKEENIVFPHVIAHSFGGRVAVKCASRGDIFDKMVLCGCAGIVPKRGARYRLRVGAYRLVKKFAPRYAEAHFGSEEYRTLPPVMRESYKKIVNEDLRGDAEKIARPVLFVNGDKDDQTPLSSIAVYLSRIRGSRLFVMKGCGHFAHLENPSEFNLAVEEFLQ